MKHLWIPVVLILLIPVPVVLLSHPVKSCSGENGVLLLGISSLDSLLETSSGRPALLNFWATWCGPCVRELPELEALAEDLGDEALLVAVDIGDPDLNTLESFRETNPVGLTVIWLDPEEAVILSDRYDLPDALPVTIVVDRSGNEAVRAVGARSLEWFRAAIEGASAGEVTDLSADSDIHVYVIGPSDDPLVESLINTAVEIAGEEAVEQLDPNVPEDSVLMAEAYLPTGGWPYAQLCVSGACRPPVTSPEALLEAFREMN